MVMQIRTQINVLMFQEICIYGQQPVQPDLGKGKLQTKSKVSFFRLYFFILKLMPLKETIPLTPTLGVGWGHITSSVKTPEWQVCVHVPKKICIHWKITLSLGYLVISSHPNTDPFQGLKTVHRGHSSKPVSTQRDSISPRATVLQCFSSLTKPRQGLFKAIINMT